MTNNSVTIISNHKGRHIEIVLDGQLTHINASDFSIHQYKLITRELWRWKESGYIGYPDLSIGK